MLDLPPEFLIKAFWNGPAKMLNPCLGIHENYLPLPKIDMSHNCVKQGVLRTKAPGSSFYYGSHDQMLTPFGPFIPNRSTTSETSGLRENLIQYPEYGLAPVLCSIQSGLFESAKDILQNNT